MKELILLGSSHAHERTDRQLEGQSLQQPKSHHLVGTTPLSVVIRVLHLDPSGSQTEIRLLSKHCFALKIRRKPKNYYRHTISNI